MSERTRLERLLLYKRYIDFLVDKELEKMVERQRARIQQDVEESSDE